MLVLAVGALAVRPAETTLRETLAVAFETARARALAEVVVVVLPSNPYLELLEGDGFVDEVAVVLVLLLDLAVQSLPSPA